MSAHSYVAGDWYDSPDYYDLIFDQETESQADFVEAVAEKHSTNHPTNQLKRGCLRILEPACGSGRLMKEFASRGHRVAGFDRSRAMLAAARKRMAVAECRGSLKRASLESFSMAGQFDIAHCLVSSFKYVLDENGAVSHLRCLVDHLRTGGIYVLGIHLTDYARRGCEHERWTGSCDDFQVVCNTRTWPPDRRTRLEKMRNRLRVLHANETRERCLETHWECRTYSSREFFRTLANVPELRPVGYYDFNHDIGSPKPPLRSKLRDDVVFVLRKERKTGGQSSPK